MKLNPEDYDYIWTDYEVNYIFASCYLFKEFRKNDFVLIYDNKHEGLYFFLAKKDKERLSRYGMKVYNELYRSWQKRLKKSMHDAEITIAKVKRDNPKKMSERKIRERIIDLAYAFQNLGNDYFFTEFFVTESAERSKKEVILKNLKDSAEKKLRARELLNSFYNYNILFRKYISEIERRRKRNDLEWQSIGNIIRVIDNKMVKTSSIVMKDWILAKRNAWKIIEGKNGERIKERFKRHFFKIKDDKIAGMIANNGKYTGRATVIRTVFSDNVKSEISKVKRGDVLIASTTGPEVMEACQKAGAIVTDEGGLTSHAGIVSRELGIPCIVGTKFATKVFKEGDIVEVDADNGTVRKVK